MLRTLVACACLGIACGLPLNLVAEIKDEFEAKVRSIIAFAVEQHNYAVVDPLMLF